jgi:uncharacterized coiled-coil DUF342 family protein
MVEMKDKITELRNKRSLLIQSSDAYHKKILELKSARENLIKDLEKIRNEIQELVKQKNDLFMKLVEKDAKAYLLMSSLRSQKDFTRERKLKEELEIKSKIAQEVEQKLKEGKPLSFDELKIYYELNQKLQ